MFATLHSTNKTNILQGLFDTIGPVTSCNLVYDKQDRSRGIAFVVYPNIRYARAAIEEFDGANANGQPIRLSFVSNLPEARRAVERQPRSLMERIADSARQGGRQNDASDDDNPRRSNTNRAPPENIDRYVPGQNGGAPRNGGRNDSRRRSPRRNDRGTRRPGQRRQAPRERTDQEGHAIVGGRPRKTAEELDAEMDNYWGGGAEGSNSGSVAPAGEDIEMDGEI
jgi:THO complex subunit 4